MYELLREAILKKKQVTAYYDGLMRQFCPHALGLRDGEAYCLAYQFGGESHTGVIQQGSPRNWRCFAVHRLQNAQVHYGDWHSCETQGGPSRCFDQILVEAS